MKILLAGAIFLGLIASLPARTNEPQAAIEQTKAAKIANEIVNSTVLIHCFKGGFGSGVVVYQDQEEALIATAAHVIGDTEINLFAFTQIDKLGKTTTLMPNDFLKIVKKNITTDLILIRTLPVWKNHASLFSTKNVETLENYSECFVAGFPVVRGNDPTYTVHITSGLICSLEGSERMRISAPIIFGNSGGGVWVLHNGRYKLAGLVHSVHSVDRTRAHIIYHIGEATEPKKFLEFLFN